MQLAGGDLQLAAEDEMLPDCRGAGGERPNHAKLGHRVGVTLRHEPLRFGAGLVSADLPLCDKEPLIGREAVNEF
jgi:hypothetical protein